MSDEQNKDVVRRQIEETWGGRDADAMKPFVTEELYEETVEHVVQLLDAVPDVEVEIEDLFAAEGDRVVARLLITGTHTGAPFAGVPASGNRLSWGSIRIYHVADGKIDKTWAMQDRLALMEQLGAVHPVEQVDWASGVPPSRK